MSKNKLLADWIKKNNYLLNPLASREWDDLVAEKEAQIEIKKSKGPLLYCYIEQKFASDHARIVDVKLREAFAKLSIADFSNPSGFAERKKASTRVENFFNVRNALAFFIKDDIKQHAKRDSQLNAFRRWITVADLLKEKHCYEGYFLVVSVLLQVDIDFKYNKDLPKYCRKKFDKQCITISPTSNFANLRREISNNNSDKKFTPICIRSKDITALNTVINDSDDSAVKHSKYSSYQLKQKILVDILCEREKPLTKLPQNLSQKYEGIEEQYKKDMAKQSEVEVPDVVNVAAKVTGVANVKDSKTDNENVGSVSNTSKTPTDSNLYRDLLPSFWHRKCSKREYWKKAFAAPHDSPAVSKP
ncbi:RasGEF domain-containing protein [Legionella cardiaca]|uniref:RasGEF domain-containing protein n=1 Tax=Legionella cardiaca TaxID=1071983 RepID=A0ABY8AYD9_9GAMM|nr:RasGEF domain-containing protein [Legionella cardiaca]WED44481.1 RasGEF domain-containing protein [Legionella cardiaca]